ncbi:hypothetical protein V496_04650 [Pseudogymnoascus sp. VKM F-4515 (FW-2607)]|nr:hypothetical protein V496_04650 [Pseudogymnoascus sp. VKM F-4515 (FW-2607)]
MCGVSDNANNKELNDDKVQRGRIIRKPGLWKKMEKRRREGGKEGEREKEMSMSAVATMERTHMKYTPPPPRPRTLHAHTHKRLEATAFLAADYESGGSTLYSGVELSKVQRSHCYSGSET